MHNYKSFIFSSRKVLVVLFASLSLILAACGGGGESQEQPSVEANIRFLSSNDTVTEYTHVILQGSTTFVAADRFEVTWNNQSTGGTGTGTTWGQSSCDGFTGICSAPILYFAADVPLQHGSNNITVSIRSLLDGITASDTISITRIEDSTPPTVYRIFPNDNDILVEPDTSIRVIFDEEMDPSSLTTDAFIIYDHNGNKLAGTYETFIFKESVESSYLPGIYCDDPAIEAQGGHVFGVICDWKSGIRFIPNSPLDQETIMLDDQTYLLNGYTHTIFVSGTVTDLAGGNAMLNDNYFKFSTGYQVD